MIEKLYAVMIDEGYGEFLCWQALQPETERRFFKSGTGIVALIFSSPNSAHAFVKRNGVLEDFDEGTQYYVRKVTLLPNKD